MRAITKGTQNMKDRNERMYILRGEGATYVSLSKEYGISCTRVRQICRGIQNRIDWLDSAKTPEMRVFLEHINTRARNVLQVFLVEDLIDTRLVEIANSKPSALLEAHNCDKGVLLTIAYALKEAGAIDDMKEWVRIFEPKKRAPCNREL